MPTFYYKARDRQGRAVEGAITAATEKDAAEAVSRQNLIPISISAEAKLSSLGSKEITFFEKKIKLEDINLFTRQVLIMHRAGVPIVASLASLRDQMKLPRFKRIISTMIRDVEGGAAISIAFSHHEKTFGHLYVSMVRSGEASGKLEEALEHIVEMGEFQLATQDKIASATRYPIIVLSTMICAFIFVVTFIMPKFTSLYAQYKSDLPLPTKILLGINHVVRHQWLGALGVIIVFIIAFRFAVRTPQGRYVWDLIKIKMPLFGEIFFNLAMGRFAKTLSDLLASGVPILEALQLVSKTVSNAVVEKAVLDVRRSVNEGRGMREPMQQSGFFSPMVVQMVATGEQSGKIDELLKHVSDYYIDKVNSMVKNIATYIEPVMVFLMGGLALLLALGVFLPMWGIMSIAATSSM